MGSPVAAFHSRAVASSLAVRIVCPSGLKSTDRMKPSCVNDRPDVLATSRTSAVLSKPAVRMVAAVGAEGHGRDRVLVADRRTDGTAFSTSQSRAMPSNEPVRTVLPSGPKATARTQCWCRKRSADRAGRSRGPRSGRVRS